MLELEYLIKQAERRADQFGMLLSDPPKPHPDAELLRALVAALRKSAEFTERCAVCDEPFKAGDLCSSDIELGTCHAACLEGSPTVDLDTGEPVDGPIPMYPYDEGSGDVEQAQAEIDVLAERRRQVEAEGWTPEHDDRQAKGDEAP